MSSEDLMTLLPQFDQIELIGRGGMGVVYKARQKNLERFVALKVLSPEVAAAAGFAERFSREARAMARLNHPNIVAIYDFGRVEHNGAGLYYLTMEFVDGSNLRTLLKQLSPAQALAIVPQICEALQYAHDIGIIHRDIKPENILVDKKGRVKIADFGLAKLLQQAKTPTDYTLTQGNLVMGTPSYMAPEQLEHPSEVDHRADVYSLGVVFYEMLTGQLPKGRFALPSQKLQIDVRFDEIVLKALEHDRELRYQHASEVRTSVESVRNAPVQQPVEATPITPPIPRIRDQASTREVEAPSPPVPPRLARMAVIAAICGILGVLAASLMVFALFNIPFNNQGVFDLISRNERESHWAVALFCIGAIIAGLSAAAMTLLGAIAVAQIRRSPGELYGLRLALFDALLCPLLLLNAIVLESLASLAELNQHSVATAPVFILALVLTPLCDVGLYWLAWKKLRIVGMRNIPGFPLALKVPAAPIRVVEYQYASQGRNDVEKVTSESSGIAAPSTDPTKTIGHELTPGQAAPLKPRFRIGYFLLSTVIFTAAFYAALALWNLRWPGVALGGVVIFVALGAATALGRNFRLLLAHWKTDSPIKAVVRFAFCLTCCVGGYYFVLAGTFADRERNLFLYRDTSNFATQYTGKEYQLVRHLPSYQHSIPQVELIDAYARPAYANFFFCNGVFDLSADPADINFRLFLGFWLLGSGVVMLFVGGGRMLKSNRSWRVWIWPVTLTLAIIGGWMACGFMQALLGFVWFGSSLSGGEPVKFSLNDVRQSLQAFLTSHGYAPADMNMYSMNRIPDGDKIGFAGVENFVKPSPFDRWRWTGGRLVPSQPAVQLFYVTTAWQPPNSYGLPSAASVGAPHVETYLMWTIYGTSLDDAAAYNFNDQLRAVAEATKTAAPTTGP